MIIRAHSEICKKCFCYRDSTDNAREKICIKKYFQGGATRKKKKVFIVNSKFRGVDVDRGMVVPKTCPYLLEQIVLQKS